MKSNVDGDTVSEHSMSLADRKKAERANKRKADSISCSKPHKDDCCLDHIIGSAAEVECLWLVACYLLTTQRASLTPIVFEAVLFLKFNSSLWTKKRCKKHTLL